MPLNASTPPTEKPFLFSPLTRLGPDGQWSGWLRQLAFILIDNNLCESIKVN